jgi:general secretion pathway protein L
VKAVEFDVSFGRIELGDYLIERVVESQLQEVQARANASTDQANVPEGTPVAPKEQVRQVLTEGQIAAIRRLLADRPLKYDKLVVSFPKAWTTTRVFHFPTKDRKTIQSSLSFELDDDIPFSTEQVIHDFAVLNYDGTTSTVFTAVALKSDLTSLLSELQMLGLDPDSVTIDAWASAHLLKRSVPREYEGRPLCVINIGNKQTSIQMLVGEGPVLTHVSSCAGADITRAIAGAYSLSYDQAEKAKVDGAFLLTQLHLTGEAGGEPLNEDQKHFAGVIADALVPMLREIKQTLMSYKTQFKLSPRAIFITGGSSQIPNLQLYLEEQLKIPVFPLSYMSRIVGQTLQLSEANEAQISLATGLALSQVKVDRNYNINFRKDAFAKSGGLGALDWNALRRPLKYVAASLAFVYVNLLVQGFILSSRASRQDAALERAIKSVVGAVNPGVMNTYKNSPSALKSAVNKELAKYKETQVTPAKPQTSAFEILNKVSTQMPKDMTLDVTVFQVKDGKFKLTGLVDLGLSPARIVKALEETKLLTDVTKDKSEEDPKTKRVKFEISGKVAEAGNVKTR